MSGKKGPHFRPHHRPNTLLNPNHWKLTFKTPPPQSQWILILFLQKFTTLDSAKSYVATTKSKQ